MRFVAIVFVKCNNYYKKVGEDVPESGTQDSLDPFYVYDKNGYKYVISYVTVTDKSGYSDYAVLNSAVGDIDYIPEPKGKKNSVVYVYAGEKKDENLTYIVQYDALGKVKSVVYKDGKAYKTWSDDVEYKYKYNNDGSIIKTGSNGQVTTIKKNNGLWEAVTTEKKKYKTKDGVEKEIDVILEYSVYSKYVSELDNTLISRTDYTYTDDGQRTSERRSAGDGNPLHNYKYVNPVTTDDYI